MATTDWEGKTRGKMLINLGGIVWAVGLVLIIGNVSGLLRTFPYAGFLTTVIGWALQNAGQSVVRETLREAFTRVRTLLAERHYKTALGLVLEDAKRREAPAGSFLDRASAFLVQNGVPPAQAQTELKLLLALALSNGAASA